MSSVSASMSLTHVPTYQEGEKNYLSTELMERICEYLDAQGAANAVMVSKHWNSALNEEPVCIIQKIRNKFFFSKKVVAEVPVLKYPPKLIRLLQINNISYARMPKICDDMTFIFSTNSDDVHAPISVVRSGATGNEKMVFRASGQVEDIENIFLNDDPAMRRLPFRANMVAICAIFPGRGDSSRYQICSHFLTRANSFSTENGNNRLDYSALGELLGTPLNLRRGNPISIIRLYCGDDTPFLDLRIYFPGFRSRASLY